MSQQPHPRQQCNGGIAPEPTFLDHLLSPQEQHRIARLLTAAGFENVTTCVSIKEQAHRGATRCRTRKARTVGVLQARADRVRRLGSR